MPALYIWVVRRKLPESPRWLALLGEKAAALAIVEQIEAEVAKTNDVPELTEENLKAVSVAGKTSIVTMYDDGGERMGSADLRCTK